MLHDIRDLAEDHHLDAEQLEKFARANGEDLGVVETRTGLAVASFDVDDFIATARTAGVPSP